MIVDIDKLAEALNYLAEINAAPLESIEWVDRFGESIWPSQSKIKEWKFVGLNNTSFAATHILEDA